jgi:hypothetical protein
MEKEKKQFIIFWLSSSYNQLYRISFAIQAFLTFWLGPKSNKKAKADLKARTTAAFTLQATKPGPHRPTSQIRRLTRSQTSKLERVFVSPFFIFLRKMLWTEVIWLTTKGL